MRVSRDRAARLLQELASERVEAREKADEELRALGPRIRPKLADALKDARDAEQGGPATGARARGTRNPRRAPRVQRA